MLDVCLYPYPDALKNHVDQCTMLLILLIGACLGQCVSEFSPQHKLIHSMILFNKCWAVHSEIVSIICIKPGGQEALYR